MGTREVLPASEGRFSQEGGSCSLAPLQSTWEGAGLFVSLLLERYNWSFSDR